MSSGSVAGIAGLRLRLARRVSPLEPSPVGHVALALPGPRQASVRIPPFLPPSIGILSFDSLSVPTASPDLARFPLPPLSPDLTHIAVPEHADRSLDEFLLPPVSDNLLKLLRRPRVGGKVFTACRAEQPTLPLTHPPLVSRSPGPGRRQQFTRKPSHSDDGLDIWDRLLPILSPPPDFSFAEPLFSPLELYGFQREGVQFLAQRDAALLGDDMGTGKTIQAAVTMSMLFQSGRVRRALVVCPRSVLPNWVAELDKWAPNLDVVQIRASRPVRELWWLQSTHVHLTTYETLRQDIDEVENLPFDFDLVILDEVQKIKNPGAGISQASKKLRAARRWGLSGTPIENRLEDLLSIFDFVQPGLFRSGEGITPAEARTRIAPYFLRRRKEDVLDQLPEKVVINQWPELPEAQRAAYERAETEGVVHLRELGASVTVPHVLALLGKLKQICNFDPETRESGKLDWLLDQLDSVVEDGDDKALVFSQYAQTSGVEAICESLVTAGYDPIAYHGGMSDRQRREAVDALDNDQSRSVMVLSTLAGGLGLNLQAANYVVHFDHWWNPATGNQAEDRVHRIGQTKTVFVYHLWAEDTVEQRIGEILDQKRRLFEEVIDSQSNVDGTALTEDELFQIFGLENPRSVRGEPQDVDGLLNEWARDCKRHATDFEKLVARVWKAQGYGVSLTPASHDKGIDIIATRSEAGGESRLAIQCKLRSSPVGIPEAQRLVGLVEADRRFSAGVIVTNATFSQDCLRWSRDQGRLKLVDRDQLNGLVAQLGLDLAKVLAD